MTSEISQSLSALLEYLISQKSLSSQSGYSHLRTISPGLLSSTVKAAQGGPRCHKSSAILGRQRRYLCQIHRLAADLNFALVVNVTAR